MEKKKLKKPRANYTIFYVIFWLILVGMCFALVVGQAGRYNDVRTDLSDVEAEIDRATARNEYLQHQIEFFDVDAYVENLARERLGMVRPNELIFRNIAE